MTISILLIEIMSPPKIFIGLSLTLIVTIVGDRAYKKAIKIKRVHTGEFTNRTGCFIRRDTRNVCIQKKKMPCDNTMIVGFHLPEL